MPNVAEISLGVTGIRPTALEAMEANNRMMTRLIEALKGRGVDPKDIQTSQVSVTPQYTRPAETKPGVPEEATVAKVVGYEVANTARVTTRDRAKIGDLIDVAVKAGSNQMYGIAFRIDDRESVLADLRGKALDAARKNADLYARRSSMALGTVLQITEADSTWLPAPQIANGPLMMVAPAPVAATAPFSAGEQEVNHSVTVSYELTPLK